jgi:predicted ester cyclase
MTTETTREVIESYERGEPRIADDAVYVDVSTGESLMGADAIRDWFRKKHGEAFDVEFERSDFIVEGSRAVQAGHLVGTHIGEYLGVSGSGKPVRIPLVVLYDVADGKIIHADVHMDAYSFLRQVGAL